MNIEVLVAEDHPLLGWSVSLICKSMGYKPVIVSTCEDVLQELKRKVYTHLILDLTLGDGSALNIFGKLRQRNPTLQILVYSSEPEAIYGPHLRQEFGVQYYICKTEHKRQSTKQFHNFLSNKPGKEINGQSLGGPLSLLTQREKDILPYLANEWSSFKIAEHLDVQASTIRGLTKRIKDKTGAKSLDELVRLVKMNYRS